MKLCNHYLKQLIKHATIFFMGTCKIIYQMLLTLSVLEFMAPWNEIFVFSISFAGDICVSSLNKHKQE
jgi:hypothetical protein